MNAANITHGLKLAGGNTRMWLGVLVVAIVFAIAIQCLFKEENEQHIQRGIWRSEAAAWSPPLLATGWLTSMHCLLCRTRHSLSTPRWADAFAKLKPRI